MLKPVAADPLLVPFEDGAGRLLRDGEVCGHVFTVVGKFWTPSRPLSWQPWVWLIVVWADGEREMSEEDYPPWTYVGEMQRGSFAWDRPGQRSGEYVFEWLGPELATAMRAESGIGPEDF